MTSFFLLPDYPLSLMFRPSHLCIEVDSYKNVITNLKKDSYNLLLGNGVLWVQDTRIPLQELWFYEHLS